MTVFVDETGFSYQVEARTTWGPKGHTPVLRTVSKRRQVSTAIGLTASGRIYREHFDHAIHGGDMVVLLEHLRRRVGGPMILIWDHLVARGHDWAILAEPVEPLCDSLIAALALSSPAGPHLTPSRRAEYVALGVPLDR